MAERVKRLSAGFLAWLERSLAERGLTPNSAALRAGVDPAQVSKGIAGKLNLSDRVLGELAPLIGMSAIELVTKANADRWGAPAPDAQPAPSIVRSSSPTHPAGYIPWTADEGAVFADAMELGVPLGAAFDPEFRRKSPEQRAGQFELWRRHLERTRAWLAQEGTGD